MVHQAQRFLGYIFDRFTGDEYRRKAIQIRDGVEKAFTEHPKQTGETYLQHLWFTVRISFRFVFISFVLLTHGLFPFLFTRATSNQIDRIHNIMRSRVPKPIAKLPIGWLLGARKSSAAADGPARIGIIGGGFSGTLVLANLIKTLETPATVEWFDETNIMGSGLAYGTRENCHLLNVRADKMGAFAGNPTGFYTWLQTEDGKQQVAQLWPDRDIREDTYVPRLLYRAYLKSILSEALQVAQQKNITVHTHHTTVTDVEPQTGDAGALTLLVEKGNLKREVPVDVLVLATGNLPPRHFSFQPGLIRGVKHYVANVWQPGHENLFPENVGQLTADDEVVVIGTGLTMVDSVLTLKKYGYKGTITAISRHGWLPASHAPAKPYPKWEWVDSPSAAPSNVLAMFVRLKQEIKKARQSDYDWRSVVDSLRPVTQVLWQRLSNTEKRKFLRRLFTLWNVHRHRMAPEIHAQIKSLQQCGTLKVVPGRIYYVGSDEQALTVAYRKRGSNRVETIRAALVLNCTGPEYDIAASSHRLLKNLRDRKLVSVDSLRMGISTTSSGSAEGKAADRIYPIGTLLVGERLECTAVPELRDQASNLASSIIQRISQLQEGAEKGSLLGEWI